MWTSEETQAKVRDCFGGGWKLPMGGRQHYTESTWAASRLSGWPALVGPYCTWLQLLDSAQVVGMWQEGTRWEKGLVRWAY